MESIGTGPERKLSQSLRLGKAREVAMKLNFKVSFLITTKMAIGYTVSRKVAVWEKTSLMFLLSVRTQVLSVNIELGRYQFRRSFAVSNYYLGMRGLWNNLKVVDRHWIIG
jgi:hypothetical protein